MNYQEANKYLENITLELGSDYSLKEVKKLCELAGSPDRKCRLIHIAGTNGKGSVGAYISHCLAMCGYRVGRYVSPALFDKKEIIQKISGTDFGVEIEYISEQEVATQMTLLANCIDDMKADGYHQPTAFEIETVMAFLQFQAWHVDIAVVEVGMGGRLDATNIISNPVLSVFTQISMDHTAILGDSLLAIANEKYGILKPGVPVVSIRQEETIMERLRELCQRRGLSLQIAEPSLIYQKDFSLQATSFTYKGLPYTLGQLGEYQLENAIVAIEAMQVLNQNGFHKINISSVSQALRETKWTGRFELISKDPFLLMDGAHNPAGAVALKKSLELYFPGTRFAFIVGVFRDKDYPAILKTMLPMAARVYTIPAPGERGLPAQMLADEATKIMQGHRMVPVTVCNRVGEALSKIQASGHKEPVLVFGSLSFLHEVYRYFDTLLYI